MNLKKYIEKRDFKKTEEPKPKKGKSSKELIFVVQKHHASHLHYDFRLEVDGVLKSWAVPKGPSMNPADKRLAVMVEDHPYDYRTFEGIIPEGNYGAGTVMVWDEGTYTPLKSMQAGLKKGHLEFILQGTKLQGEFHLIRLQKSEKDWLLIKKKDEFSGLKDVLKQDRSVVTRRSMDEIGGSKESKSSLEKLLKKGIRSPMPQHVRPMLGTLVESPFDKPDWFYEIKWDGYRALAQVNHKDVLLYSRTDKSFNVQFAPLVDRLKELKSHLLLDGEIVVLNKQGMPQFQWMQNYQRTQEGDLCLYVFDILYCNGYDLRQLPLRDRKEILKQAVTFNEVIRYSDHIEERGKAFFAQVSKKNLEGMMCKDSSSSYQMKRSKDWLKVKTHLRQEVVIGGFTEPRGARKKFGALLIGYYDKEKLIYAGHVGTGFTEKSLSEIYDAMKPLIQVKSPFKNPPHPNAPVTWLKPELIGEVSFSEWTEEGIMRHPSFEGLRSDKTKKEVHREAPMPLPAKAQSKKGSRGQFVPTNEDKVFWEKEGITKGDLIEFYEAISPFILPYLKDRPMVMHRFPNGVEGQSFYQKNSVGSTPDWIETADVEHEDRTIRYILVQDKPSLLYIVNMGCIEMHPFNSRVQSLDFPDYLVIDLDPGEVDFTLVVKTAQTVHEILEESKIPNYCKTSGSRGLHIFVPLGAKYTFEQATEFTRLIATITHSKLPEITSIERSPSKRRKLVYLDFLQNHKGVCNASVYSIRPKPGATVSTPLDWNEVNKSLDPKKFTIKTVPKRLQKVGDLFKPVLGKGMNLVKSLKYLEKYA